MKSSLVTGAFTGFDRRLDFFTGMGLNSSALVNVAMLGFKVLMIDLDPQGHLTQCMDVDHDTIEATLYNVMIERVPMRDVIIDTELPNLKLIPANLDLSPVELALTSANARELRLRKACSKYRMTST